MDINRARDQRILESVARLTQGVDAGQAQAELGSVAARLAAQYPKTNAGWGGATVVPLRTAIVGDVDKALLIVVAVVGFILLIGCANLANLLLARGASRSHEMAIRIALGAGRMRIVRQLLTESLVLAILGGALGLVFSVWGVKTILALSADTLPRVEDVRLDSRVIGFALVLAVVTGWLCGLLPAVHAARTAPQQNLKGGRGTVGGGQGLRSALVVAEVGLAVVLVIGAGLMARSFLELRSIDPGFDPQHSLAVTIQLNIAGVDRPVRYIRQQRDDMIARIATLPRVVSVGAINGTSLPLQEKDTWEVFQFTRADGSGAEDGGMLRADRSYVSSGYLRTMRIPLLRGTPLPDRPPTNAPVPFLISDAAARRFWPGQDPVGQAVHGDTGDAVVTGVVGDVHQRGLAREATPAVYFPLFVGPRIVTTLVVRTVGDPLTLAGPIRQALRQLDPNQPIRSIDTLSGVMSESISRDRFFTVIFGIFGALALVLAAVGVYGVLAYSVGQRTQEIGVRMALGAKGADVLRMVVGGGMMLVLSGVALGALASLSLARVLKAQLHGVSATDPITFVAAPSILVVVALLACYFPARRATRIDPITALRNE